MSLCMKKNQAVQQAISLKNDESIKNHNNSIKRYLKENIQAKITIIYILSWQNTKECLQTNF